MLLVFVWLLGTFSTTTRSQEVDILSNILDSAYTPIKVIEADLSLMEDKLRWLLEEKVKIQLYYESLCPDCRQFDSKQFLQVYLTMQDYLEVITYPYGNAKTVNYDNGTVEIKCQHGVAECYGNQLHACAIELLDNTTAAIIFNSCMMDPKNDRRGSDDPTADKCGSLHNIDTEPIKRCAKSKRGFDLLKHYGDESHKVKYHYVPFVLINGAEWDQDANPDFKKTVCDAFTNKPTNCLT